MFLFQKHLKNNYVELEIDLNHLIVMKKEMLIIHGLNKSHLF